MTSTARNLMSVPGVASFLEELCVGRFRWDLIHPFPRQSPGERRVGDAAVAEIGRFLTERVDPAEIDVSSRLPGGLIDDLRSRGYLGLTVEPDLGGLGLSRFNAFRAIVAASGRSSSVGSTLAIQNGIGAGPFASVLPPGPLRDFVRERVAQGVVSGSADTEPAGAANTRRWTTATPTEDGTAYLLSGEKIHIGNGSIADLLAVTATVYEDGEEQTRLFFVDTETPGLRVESTHEFMGIKGFPSGRLILRDVRVPKEHMLVEESAGRLTPELTFLLVKGRLQVISAPALAIAERCAQWSREFALRRGIDGRGLGEYDEVQRNIAASLADVYALETVAEWVMLDEGRRVPVNLLLEQLTAKNITSTACWRVVERTMSFLASEGFETASSKARRGVPAIPMERAFRDARGLRIAGGVDFQLDNWFSRLVTFTYYYPEPDNVAEITSDEVDLTGLRDANLTPRNEEHLRFVAGEVRAFAQTCLRLARRHPDPEELFAQERVMVLLTGIMNELLTMSLVLARTSGRADADGTQDLADIHCSAARHRLADHRRRLDDDGPDYAKTCAGWLSGERADLFGRDLTAEGSFAPEETV